MIRSQVLLRSLVALSVALASCHSEESRSRRTPRRATDTDARVPSPNPPPQAPPLAPPAVGTGGPVGVRLVNTGCVAQSGGCPAPHSLPDCPPNAGTLSIQDIVAAGARLVGNRVSARGTLARQAGAPTCGTQQCPPGRPCCNRCSTPLVLEASADAASPRLSLAMDDHPEAYRCEGDSSAMCCPYAERREVIAVGTVVIPAGGGSTVVLQNPTLCLAAPPAPVEPVAAPVGVTSNTPGSALTLGLPPASPAATPIDRPRAPVARTAAAPSRPAAPPAPPR